jgi:cell shape-determining protein MreC
MMNSYRRNRNRKLILTTVLVVVIFGIDLLSGGLLRREVRSLGSGISEAASHIGGALFGSGFFSSRASLEAQNSALTEQLAQYQERSAGYDVLLAENAQLRDIAHLASEHAGLTAPIVSSVISSPYGTFLIGAGASDNVARGNLVLTSGGLVVGRITDVGAHTSTVQEIFAPNSSVNAVVAGTSVSVGGSGGGNAHALLPRGVPVSVGDAVLSPELGGRAIGIVGAIASSTASASQDVYIRLPVDIGALQFVYVVSS